LFQAPGPSQAGGGISPHDRDVAAARVILGGATAGQPAEKASVARTGWRDPAKAKLCRSWRGPGIRSG